MCTQELCLVCNTRATACPVCGLWHIGVSAVFVGALTGALGLGTQTQMQSSSSSMKCVVTGVLVLYGLPRLLTGWWGSVGKEFQRPNPDQLPYRLMASMASALPVFRCS